MILLMKMTQGYHYKANIIKPSLEGYIENIEKVNRGNLRLETCKKEYIDSSFRYYFVVIYIVHETALISYLGIVGNLILPFFSLYEI